MIRLTGLSKAYGAVKALDCVDLEVRAGEIVGLLGPNGAGKSTCIRTIAGLVPPDAGSVTLNGIDIHADPMAAKRILGYLPEFPNLYDSLTAWEFIEFVATLRDVPLDHARQRAQVLARDLQIDDKLDDMIGTFSKGMRQKISLITTWVSDPPVMVLDEPLSGLDPHQSRVVKDLILATVKQADNAILLSTHLTPVAEELCDRLYLIFSGRIVAHGTLAEVTAKYEVTNLEEVFVVAAGQAGAGLKDGTAGRA